MAAAGETNGAKICICELWRIDLSRVFASKLVLEDEMAGRLTAQSKEIIASVSQAVSGKTEGGFKSQMFLGELPRPEEFQNDR